MLKAVIASTWILAALRNEKFSYEEVAEAVKEKLEELNNRPFTGNGATIFVRNLKL